MATIKPQSGPQELFLSSCADIVIFGGGAGGGKTVGILLEGLRHKDVKGFGVVIFRRTYPEIKNEGSLWDTSAIFYPLIGGEAVESALLWKFKSGTSIRFAHLQHEKDKYDWQGSQIPLIEMDELTHFTESQFFYLMSRNRSTCGVKPYIRATCNPDADSWVARFIDWWIGEDG
ncbi:MAG: terminase family protein, partial [Gammaproteobacteria bacterium]|nr:terminase family protein [Gammaproteobacteria bacterium]